MSFNGLRISVEEISRMVSKLMVFDDEPIDVFVSAALSLLCEPGDSIAGLVCSRIGQREALIAIIDENVNAALLLSRLEIEVSERPVGLERALSDGLIRWRKRLSITSLENAFDKMRAVGGRVVSPKSSLWPAGFADL